MKFIMAADFEIEDINCPKCGHAPIHNRDCAELTCNDGFIDQHYDDPINFMPGEDFQSQFFSQSMFYFSTFAIFPIFKQINSVFFLLLKKHLQAAV